MAATYAQRAPVRLSRKPLGHETMVVVAISGLHGAGKTTAARALARKFGLKYISAGSVFRRLARERGMTLDEFSRYVERHPEIDRQIDQMTIDAAKEGNVLVDARLAGWMAKDADVKILLTAPLEVRARRIALRENRGYEEVLAETIKRERSEARRFKRFYGIDVNDYSVFDLVLDTGNWSAKEMIRILETAVGFVVKRRG
ncbi:MAG: AAA family ATPase [Hadesarchaea archaeon]|nr:AAA family ATPase [Hadesarchaea archaeon]